MRGETWTRERFDDELARRVGPQAVSRAHQILEWAGRRQLRVWWGQGVQRGGFVPVYDAPDGTGHQLFEVWTDGKLEVLFQHLATKGPFADATKRRELRDRLNAAAGISIPVDAIGRRPTFSLLALADADATDRVLAVFDWVLEEIRQGQF